MVKNREIPGIQPYHGLIELVDSAIKFYTTKRLSEIYEMVDYVTKLHLLNNLIRK